MNKDPVLYEDGFDMSGWVRLECGCIAGEVEEFGHGCEIGDSWIVEARKQS